ncbi:MAG TPA: amidase family protein, partial [Acetobacteraceae bacterium]
MPNPVIGWDEWASHDATSLAALVKQGKVTPRELAGQVAAGVEALNGQIGAVLEVFADVRENPEADRPNPEGLLHGVPVFLKDLGQALAGRSLESGSKLHKGVVAKSTEPLVENVLAAGLVPLGRSTTPEFGMTFDTT